MSRPATSTRIRLGTRGSPLAKWQADWVAAKLCEHGFDVELVLVTTSGDIRSDSLSASGGQGLFTKEIQRALLDRRVDLAVHSLKDLPTESIGGLTLAAVPPRDSPRDVLISDQAGSIEDLPAGSHVGTGSRRRQSQLLHLRADLRVSEIRGNVDTRLRKLDEGLYDAIILAEAGLNRLGLAHRITQVLSPEVMLPAIGQGALGLETRADDATTAAAVRPLNDEATRAAVWAERALLAELHGGCLAPIGAWARIENNVLRLSAAVLSIDGRKRVSVTRTGEVSRPEALGRQAAQELLVMGAGELIDSSRNV